MLLHSRSRSMQSITIDRRFCGPPNSGNGGYVCGLLAAHINGGAEITLRVPPPLEHRLDITAGTDGAVELREAETVIATGRPALLDISHSPPASFAEAEEAARRTPYDESNHSLPTCFVCGPARAQGDGLRIFPGPLHPEANTGAVAASWVPCANLVRDDGRIAPEFVWAALDCPTAYASLAARHLGLNGRKRSCSDAWLPASTSDPGRVISASSSRGPQEGTAASSWPTARCSPLTGTCLRSRELYGCLSIVRRSLATALCLGSAVRRSHPGAPPISHRRKIVHRGGSVPVGL